MNRAQRLLTLAYKADQRNEKDIAGRIVSLAFAEPEMAEVFERLNAKPTTLATASSDDDQAETVLRRAEASTQGSIFTVEGTRQLLAIAEKAHKDGLPKVAKLIADIAS